MLHTTPTPSERLRPAATSDDEFVDPDDLRTVFASALSEMYRNEVPLYGDLVRIVHDVNIKTLTKQDAIANEDSARRITLERHGAIRLGQAHELRTIRRIFRLFGMYPVDYYDLSVASLPMHATAFRPIEARSLANNPFRVFTTLLRPELLRDEEARDLALSLLRRRRIFSDRLLQLLETCEEQGGRLLLSQVEEFIPEVLLTFCWRPTAAATNAGYAKLKSEHPILADIACFQTAHINHLTPRTLDIEAAHAAMMSAGMKVKSSIEGPPRRLNPILLRQTSFLALEEKVNFPVEDDDHEQELIPGHHKARFGEIEERGAAVTPKGRKLYNDLLGEALKQSSCLDNPSDSVAAYRRVFEGFPDDGKQMQAEGLIYCVYRCTGKSVSAVAAGAQTLDQAMLKDLISLGIVESRTITYEDFLPFSAAGIFQSNLQSPAAVQRSAAEMEGNSDLEGFEEALGESLNMSDDLYRRAQRNSLVQCAKELGLRLDEQCFDW